jgi:hypothetical protein
VPNDEVSELQNSIFDLVRGWQIGNLVL